MCSVDYSAAIIIASLAFSIGAVKITRLIVTRKD